MSDPARPARSARPPSLRSPARWLALALLAATPAAAQARVLVVDKLGGPGTFSPDIATAVAAAAPGDVVLVVARPTEYSTPGDLLRVTIPISIVGAPEPGGPLPRPLVSDAILVEPAAGERVVLASLDQGGGGAGSHEIRLRGGSATLIDVRTRKIEAQDFEELSLHGVTSSVGVVRSAPRLIAINALGRAPGLVHVQGSSLVPPVNIRSNTAAVRCSNVEIEIADSRVQGYLGFSGVVTPGTGIEGNGRLSLLGAAQVETGGSPSPAVRWSGPLRVAANATLLGPVQGPTPSPLPGQPVLRHPPAVDLGASLPVDLAGRPSALVLVLIADRPDRSPLPGVDVPLLVDLGRSLPLLTAALDPAGAASIAVAIPDVPAVRLSSWFVQGAEVDASATELRLTARAALTLR